MVGVRVVVVVVSACGVPVGVMVGVGVVRRRRRASDRGRLGGSRQEGRAGGPVVLELVKPDVPDPAQEDQAAAEGNRAEDPHGNPDRLVWTPGRGLVRSPAGRPAQAPHAPGRGARRPVQGDSGGSAGSGAEAGDSYRLPRTAYSPQAGQKGSSDHTGARHWGLAQGRNSPTGALIPSAGWRDPRRAKPAWMPWWADRVGWCCRLGRCWRRRRLSREPVRAAPARNRAAERRALAPAPPRPATAPRTHGIRRRRAGLRHHTTGIPDCPMVVSSSPNVAGVSRWPASSRGRPPGARQRCPPR